MNYWQGERVRLRGIEPTDAETFSRWHLDSDMGRNLDFVWPPISQALIKKQIEEGSLKTLEKDAFTWVIEDGSGQAVGSITTHHCDRRNGTFGYGINIAAERQKQGYATEAVRLVIKYYFDELRYNKAAVHVFSHNRASIALHEKLGFVKEGVLRQMVYTGGEYFDILCYGMTKSDFRNRE